ncbi:unnamed protein product [Parajaminaea phylloscopi]
MTDVGGAIMMQEPVASSSKPRSLSEKNLLDHVNKIRQTPSFAGFDTVLRMTGDEWMEAMIHQATLIRRSWANEYESHSSKVHATLAGEMLKTPSRKRAAGRARQVSSKAATKAKSRGENPFCDDDDKENAQAGVALESNADMTVGDRRTRSRGAPNELPKLPNPFQNKIAQHTKAKGDTTSTAKSADKEPATSNNADLSQTLGQATAVRPIEEVRKPAQTKAEPAPTESIETLHVAAEEGMASDKAATAAATLPPTIEISPTLGLAPPAASPTHEHHDSDDSMIGDDLLDTMNDAGEKPKASTPNKTEGQQPRSDFEAPAPIADAVDSEEEAAANLCGQERDDITHLRASDPRRDLDNLSERTVEVRDDEPSIGASDESLAIDGNSSRVSLALTTPSEAGLPRQKRTLASFGGAKKVTHPPAQPSSAVLGAPATSGFKSSFLKKSLRQASMRKGGGDDEVEDDAESTSMERITDTNTEVNAALQPFAADSQATTLPASIDSKMTTSELKRKSQGPAEDERPEKRLSTGRHSATGSRLDRRPQPSMQTEAQSMKSRDAATANLLRTRLDSARLRSNNPGTVGLGARGLTSPILRPTAVGSVPTSPDPANGQPRMQHSFQRLSEHPSSGNVAQLLNTWENRNSEMRSPPQKSSGTFAAGTNRLSPSKLPIPTSTTPQGSPLRKATFVPTSPSPVRKANPSHLRELGNVQLPDKSKPAVITTARITPAATPQDDNDEGSSQSTNSASAVTANATNGPTDAAGERQKRVSEAATTRMARNSAVVKTVEEDCDADDESDDRSVLLAKRRSSLKQAAARVDAVTMKDPVEESVDLRKTLPDVTGDGTSLLCEDSPVKEAEANEEGRQFLKSGPASAATQALPSQRNTAGPSVPHSATQAETNTAADGGQAGAAAGWSSRLKGLFGIAGVPSAVSAGPPAPGSGFQPKVSRSASNAVKETQPKAVQQQVQPAVLRRNIVEGSSAAAKPASVIRAEQSRRREAEELERKMKEREDKRKHVLTAQAMTSAAAKVGTAPSKLKLAASDAELKKRTRDDEDATSSVKRSVAVPAGSQHSRAATSIVTSSTGAHQSHTKATTQSDLGAASSNQSTKVGRANVAPSQEETAKKRRVSHEKEAMTRNDGVTATPAPALSLKATDAVPSAKGSAAKASAKTNANAGAASRTVSVSANGVIRQARPIGPSGSTSATAAASQSRSVTASSASTRNATGLQAANFTQQNPFQQARTAPAPPLPSRGPPIAPPNRTAPGLAAAAERIAALTSMAMAQGVTGPAMTTQNGTVPPNTEDDNVSLPSIVSEYSDSEDEETLARRARAADWTKGDALQIALRAQSNMDADLIFGVPTGSVDLNTLMPPQDHAARARMHRPRTSSANWHGADGLAQWEIDRYNQRMHIVGPGFKLPTERPAGVDGGRSAPSQNRLAPESQEHRRSVLAIGAAAAARQQARQN